MANDLVDAVSLRPLIKQLFDRAGRLKDVGLEEDSLEYFCEVLAKHMNVVYEKRQEGYVAKADVDKVAALARIGGRVGGLQDAAKMIVEMAEPGVESGIEPAHTVAGTLLLLGRELLAMASAELDKAPVEH